MPLPWPSPLDRALMRTVISRLAASTPARKITWDVELCLSDGMRASTCGGDDDCASTVTSQRPDDPFVLPAANPDGGFPGASLSKDHSRILKSAQAGFPQTSATNATANIRMNTDAS